MVNMDGIASLTDTDTLPSTLSLFDMNTEDACNELQHLEDAVLQASLARTIRPSAKGRSAGNCRVSGDPVYRVSGVCPGFGKTQSKNRARKEVKQLALRQYRQQFLRNHLNEAPRSFVKGRWVLSVKRDEDEQLIKM